MEHLTVPATPYTEIKIPFLGGQYRRDGQKYETYPARNHWSTYTIRDELTGFKIEPYLQSTRIDKSIEFLENLGSIHEKRITRAEDKSTLRTSIDFLKRLKSRTPPERLTGSSPQFKGKADKSQLPREYETERLADGTTQKTQKASSITLYQCTEFLESELRKADATPSFVQLKEDLHYLQLLAAFTCERNQNLLGYRRVTKIARLEDAIKYKWGPWVFADSQDSELWKVYSAVAKVQAWAFFGLIEQFFESLDIKVDQNDFVDSTRQNITTAPLSAYVLQIKEKYPHNGPTTTHAGWLLNFLVEAAEALPVLHQHGGDRLYSIPGAEVFFSIDTVNGYLHTALAHICNGATEEEDKPDHYFMRTRFRDAGWCRHQTKEMQKMHGPQFQYYAYMLGPPEGYNHSSCSADFCLQNSVNTGDYQTKHSSRSQDGCLECIDLQSRHSRFAQLQPPTASVTTCWGPDIRQISAILNNGQIPIILVKRTPSQGFHLDLGVEASLEDLAYVAISHVWSNGRGNPKRNELPLCQLKYVSQKVMEVLESRRPIAFWMDTLCVPLRPDLCKKAILTMRKVYQNAFATLVLDETLENWKDTGLTWIEWSSCTHLTGLEDYGRCKKEP
jgi:hypothetical protein